MKKYIALLALVVVIIATVTIALTWDGGDPLKEGETMAEKSVLDFTMKSIDGDDVKLDNYSGKVLMLVNVMSKCGYTPQYRGLESVYKKYKEQGLVVMGFPANNFFWQEPGTDQEIGRRFARRSTTLPFRCSQKFPSRETRFTRCTNS